jgi:hypothetical protein
MGLCDLQSGWTEFGISVIKFDLTILTFLSVKIYKYKCWVLILAALNKSFMPVSIKFWSQKDLANTCAYINGART